MYCNSLLRETASQHSLNDRSDGSHGKDLAVLLGATSHGNSGGWISLFVNGSGHEGCGRVLEVCFCFSTVAVMAGQHMERFANSGRGVKGEERTVKAIYLQIMGIIYFLYSLLHFHETWVLSLRNYKVLTSNSATRRGISFLWKLKPDLLSRIKAEIYLCFRNCYRKLSLFKTVFPTFYVNHIFGWMTLWKGIVCWKKIAIMYLVHYQNLFSGNKN